MMNTRANCDGARGTSPSRPRLWCRAPGSQAAEMWIPRSCIRPLKYPTIRRHRGCRKRYSDDEVPGDDPREQLAQRRIRVGVGEPETGIIDASSAYTARERRDQAGDHEGQTMPAAACSCAAWPVSTKMRADDAADAERRQLERAEAAFSAYGRLPRRPGREARRPACEPGVFERDARIDPPSRPRSPHAASGRHVQPPGQPDALRNCSA